jgi:hypothetical protein
MPTQIHAELELTDCSAELRVNDIPLPALPARRPTFELSVPVNHLLVPGANELTLYVDIEGKPSEILKPREEPPRDGARAIVRLVEYEVGVMGSPENGRVLGAMEYRGADDGSREAPRVRKVTVDPGASAGPWAWQAAPVLALDEPTRSEAERAVREVHEALFSGDAERVRALIAIRWEEMDRAYPGRDDAADRQRHAEWIAELAASPRRKLRLDPLRHDFRLVAGGRMIECIDEDHFPSIRVAQEVEPNRWAAAPYPILLARIEGSLRVVR